MHVIAAKAVCFKEALEPGFKDHKTLRGPRGGLILARANEEIEKKLNSAVFPSAQGGPLEHVIAAKAVCFKEALQPEFKTYQQQVLKNAQSMAQVFLDRGFDVVSGGTQNHLFLLSLIKGRGAQAEDDRRRLLRLFPGPRFRPLPRHRRQGRRLPVRRHGPRRRPGRRWRLPEPGAVRRRGHHHHPQDPARSARWPDPRVRC